MSGESTSFVEAWTGDGNDKEVAVNLPPKVVELINETDHIVFKKTQDMADDVTIKIAADGVITTVAAGITLDGQKVIIPAALNVNTKEFYLASFS